MPEIHADNVAEVILLAREIQESVQVGARDGVRHDTAGNLARQQFRAFVSNMTEEERLSLVAIMWIGRESYAAEEFDEAYEMARQESDSPTEAYLIGVPMLADYLELGLEALGISPGDAEDDLL